MMEYNRWRLSQIFGLVAADSQRLHALNKQEAANILNMLLEIYTSHIIGQVGLM